MRFLAVLLLIPAACAQQPDLASQSNRLQRLLQQIKPAGWPESAVYVPLLKTASEENLAVPAALETLSAHPDQIMESLTLLERIHAVQESVALLAVGVSRYQNPALAELMLGIQAEGKAARDTYRDHVLQLVADHEGQFQIADHEAQRCRAILSKDPHPAARAVKSKQ